MPEETKPYKRGINPDTASVDEIHRADDRLVDYIEDAGLPNASAAVQEIIDKPVETSAVKSQKDPNTVKILRVQRKILEVLEKIEAGMFDEQDTSIKHGDDSGSNGLTGTAQLVSEANGSDSGGFGFGDLAGLLFAGRKRKKGKKGKNNPVSKSNDKSKPKKPTPKKTSKFPKGVGKLAKGALRFMKFAGPVGLAITAGLAISDGLDGWDNAAEELGTDGELSVGNKASAALGGVVSGLSFGMLDSANLSKGFNNASGGNKTIDKYEKEGILDHETWGDSEITDWKKLAKLKAQEIQKIIDIDDWSDSVRERLEVLKTTAQAMIDQSKKAPVSLLEPTPKREDVKAVKYTMKTIPMVPVKGSPDVLVSANRTSTEPSSYKPSDLFKLYNVKNSDFDGMNPNMLSNLKSMAAEYRDLFGEPIQINSAYRSVEEQVKLKEKFGSKAAKPGYSMHNYGLAVDMNTVNADNATAAGLFTKYGFKRPVRGETWHVEPKGIDRKKIREEGVQALSGAVQATASKSTESVQQTPDVQHALKEGESVKEIGYKQDKPTTAKITNASVVQDDVDEFNITQIINDSLEEERLKNQSDSEESEIPTKHISPELAALMGDSEEPIQKSTPTKHISPELAALMGDSEEPIQKSTPTKHESPELAALMGDSEESIQKSTPTKHESPELAALMGDSEESAPNRREPRKAPSLKSEFTDLMEDPSEEPKRSEPRKAPSLKSEFTDLMEDPSEEPKRSEPRKAPSLKSEFADLMEDPSEEPNRREPRKAPSLKSEFADLMEDPSEEPKRSEPKKAPSLKSEFADLMEDPSEEPNRREPRKAPSLKSEFADLMEDPSEEPKRSEPKKAPSLKSEFADLMEDPSEEPKRSEPKKAPSLKSEFADLMEDPSETAANIRKDNAAQLKKEEHRNKSRFMNMDNYDPDYVETPAEKKENADKKAKIKARDDAKLAAFKDKQAKKQAADVNRHKEKQKIKDARKQVILDGIAAKKAAQLRYTADKKAGKSPSYSDILAEERSKRSHSTASSGSPVKKTSGFRNFMDSSDDFMDSSDDFMDDATTGTSVTTETNSVQKSTPVTHTRSMSAAEIAATEKGVEESRKPSDPNSPSRIRMRARIAKKKAARAAKAAQLAEANKVPKEMAVNGSSTKLTKETVKFKTPQTPNVVENNTHASSTNVINTEQKSVRSLELFSD